MKSKVLLTVITISCLGWSQKARASGPYSFNLISTAEVSGSLTTSAAQTKTGLFLTLLPIASLLLLPFFLDDRGNHQAMERRLACSLFIEHNLSSLSKEISRQRGQTLDGLMDLLNVHTHNRPKVAQRFASRHSEIFNTPDPSTILDQLIAILDTTG